MTGATKVPAGNLIAFAVAAVIVAVVPWLLPPYIAFELAYAGAYAIAILGLIILTGFNGQISLGHGAFMAVGGYAVALAVTRAGWPPEIAILIAAALCAVLGALVGIAALRRSGAYLALATFALAVSVAPLLKRFKETTGGSQGITFAAGHAPGPLAGLLDSERWLYYETWLILGVLFAVSFGINPSVYKTLAFAWSAAYAGVAGALIASATAYVSPDSYTLQLSITLLIGAVLGGLGSMWGAILGGLVVEFLPLWAQSINTAASSLIYGISLILVMIAMPGGIAEAIRRVSFTIIRPRIEGQPERS